MFNYFIQLIFTALAVFCFYVSIHISSTVFSQVLCLTGGVCWTILAAKWNVNSEF